jgi:hypothetical protein
LYFATGDPQEARDCVREAFARARQALGPMLREEHDDA